MSSPMKRINMRISDDNLALIREAAEANGQDMTGFVLGAALERARRVVLEERVTRLSAQDAARLEALLDSEPVEIPALGQLLRDTARQAASTRNAAAAQR